MSQTKLSLKLMVDTNAKKVLFAEVGKDFVDFLFHIMLLPVGTIVKLLNVDGMVGSLGSLYKSIESLNSDYFLTNLDKDAVLKPVSSVSVPLLSLNDTPSCPSTLKFYQCNSYENCSYITDQKGTACHSCGNAMSQQVSWINRAGNVGVKASSSGTGGYVKGMTTYMVMDNLEVKPMSAISGITLINKFNVRDVSALVEKEVEVSLKEGLAMLKASLETNAVLTTVFIGK
ncbi:hypothetical protein RND81_08G213800 [Saponaria officinalis]|uniref:DUF674 domain-containing protein n=1 Tax=Saponaria officinalis TaxID=3572 RepID=A0AAW1JCD5_SAPOF